MYVVTGGVVEMDGPAAQCDWTSQQGQPCRPSRKATALKHPKLIICSRACSLTLIPGVVLTIQCAITTTINNRIKHLGNLL